MLTGIFIFLSSNQILLNPQNLLVDVLVKFWYLRAVDDGISQGLAVRSPALGNWKDFLLPLPAEYLNPIAPQ